MYHKGDLLLCIDAEDAPKLEKGKVYTVKKMHHSFPVLEETGEMHDGSRFRKVGQEPRKE